MTTYLFTLVDGGGTVPPELGTARRLLERGHRVVVLAEDSMAEDVLAAGAELRRWTAAPNRASRRPEDDPYRDWECRNPIQLFERVLEAQFTGPAARYAENPDRTISGMVMMPTATTLLTAAPEIMPNSAEPTTAILAAPPRKWPMPDMARSAK